MANVERTDRTVTLFLSAWYPRMGFNWFLTWRLDRYSYLPVVEPPNERSKIHLSMVPLLCTLIYRAFRLGNIHATHFAMPNVRTHLRLCWFENGCPHHVHPIRIKHFQMSRPTSICPNVNEDKLCLKIEQRNTTNRWDKRTTKSVKLCGAQAQLHEARNCVNIYFI